MIKVLISIITFLLIGCGGGSSAGNASISNTPIKQELDYIAFPSAESLVKNLCTLESPNGGFNMPLAFADLNGDGKKDMIAVYVCGYGSPGKEYSGPTPNTVIVYLSQQDGSYSIGNKQLFGSDIVDVGGFTNGIVIADFNKDGKPDIGIGVSKEDSRAIGPVGVEAWKLEQTVLMSNLNGTYTVTKTPIKAASGFVQTADNDVGGVDFVYFPDAGAQAAAYRWVNNSWQQILDYPKASNGMTFWPRSANGRGSTKMVSISTEAADGPASLQLQIKNNGLWEITDKFVTPVRLVDAIIWNNTQVKTPLATVNGIQMTYATIERVCLIKMSPSSTEDIALASIGGFPVPKDWDGVSVIDERKTSGTTTFLSFSVTDKLTVLNNIFDEIPNLPFTEFQCEDVNNDGYTDLVIHRQGASWMNTVGGPVFYINNKQGKLIKKDVSDLPVPPQNSTGWPSSYSFLQDMNNDGIPDLIYYTTTSIPTQLGHSFRLYLRKDFVK